MTATADNKTKVYGTGNPELTMTYTGFYNGDTEASITPPSLNTSAILSSPAGIYPITVTGGSADNYTLIRVDGKLTITGQPLGPTLIMTNQVLITEGTTPKELDPQARLIDPFALTFHGAIFRIQLVDGFERHDRLFIRDNFGGDQGFPLAGLIDFNGDIVASSEPIDDGFELTFTTMANTNVLNELLRRISFHNPRRELIASNKLVRATFINAAGSNNMVEINLEINHRPVTDDLFFYASKGNSRVLNFDRLLKLATDRDLDPLTVSEVVALDTTSGTVQLQTGSIRYTPPANFESVDVFDFVISDSRGGFTTASVLVQVIDLRISIQKLPANKFLLTVNSSLAGLEVSIESSTDGQNWDKIAVAPEISPGGIYSLTVHENAVQTFYRARLD